MRISDFFIRTVAQSAYTKKEQKLIDQIDGILRRPPDAPIWGNEDFWQNKWPKIVDDCAAMIEAKSNKFKDALKQIEEAEDYFAGKVIVYEI